ncbi:MAG: IclR family transcriptional regulator, partial [Bdellovibrionales bacterium]|nr:IclR family transcriptional regulator [Bdellovibrionales bacterium]
MVKREKANYMIQSVSHAIDVLEELAKAGPEKTGGEIGVTELSKRLKLHKNNVFRLLATLELRGYVEQNAQTEDYRLGVKALELGQAYLAQSSLVERATPLLRALSEDTGETVSLAIIQNGLVQYPISFESKRPVRANARRGVSFPAKQNAAGRLLTAQLPNSILDEILATNTPQDAAIRNALNDLRNSGQIIDRAATEADVVSLCMIVKRIDGSASAAIQVLVPQYRVKTE